MIQGFTRNSVIFIGVFSLSAMALVAGALFAPNYFPYSYSSGDEKNQKVESDIENTAGENEGLDPEPEAEVARVSPIRMDTPEPLKSIYMTQCVAGTPSFREKLINIAETTEINSIIIDIKDYTGWLGFEPKDSELKKYFGEHCYASDMPDLVRRLNEKGIYTIARITVFQDPIWADDHPKYAVQKESTKTIWEDYKGLHFVDVSSKPFWEYIVKISQEAYDIGFDELNYDYVRFPSDGNMKDIYFPQSEKRLSADPDFGKAEALRDFFKYLKEKTDEIGVATSADLFGMVTTNRDDLNIGQVLEYALPYFDYIAPMVYPSHYPKTFNGWQNPNDYPHEVVEFAMTSAVERVKALDNATTTPQNIRDHIHPLQLRAWIQDFDYGGDYGPEEVRTQIEAVYDSGLTSWMIWDPANRYTIEALEK